MIKFTTTVLVALLGLVGCYNPDLSKVRYTCTAANPVCPDSLPCIEGWCGGPPSSEADGGGDDASTPTDPACAPTAVAWPLPGVPATVAMACQGKGPLNSLCGPKYQLCAASPLPATQCKSFRPAVLTTVRPFFASAARASQATRGGPAADMRCTWAGQPASSERWLPGCGSDGATLDTVVVCAQYPVASNCKNGAEPFGANFDCPNGSPPSDVDFANVVNTGQGGALCCKVPQ